MRSFQFPPPPPPPAPPPSTSSGPQFQVGSRNHSSPRGRGRGRGHVEQRDRFAGCNNRGHTPSLSHQAPPTSCHGASGANQTVLSPPAGIPPGSYINPAFARPTTILSHGVNHTTLLGQQIRVGSSTTCAPLSSTSAKTGHSHVGFKRKLDYLQGPLSQSGDYNSTTWKPGEQTYSSIIPNGSASEDPYMGRLRQSKKPDANVLGLTPGNLEPLYSSSESEGEDDSIDEESMLAHALKPSLTFHDTNGEMRTLNTAADLAAWRSARRANFPTKDRLSKKHAERKQIGAERKRILVEAQGALRAVMSVGRPSSKTPTHTRAQPRIRVNEGKTNSTTSRACDTAGPSSGKGALLKRNYTSKDGSGAHQCAQVSGLDEQGQGDGTSMERGQGVEKASIDQSVGPEATVSEPGTITTLTRPPASSDSLDSDSSDDPPEEITSKQQSAKMNPAPCRRFVASGYCRDGSICRFSHELPDRVTVEQKRKIDLPKKDPFAPTLDAADRDSRKSIHQRLFERDRDDQDQLVLQVIKYLGSKGLLSAAPRSMP